MQAERMDRVTKSVSVAGRSLCGVCSVRPILAGKQHCFHFQCKQKQNGSNGFGSRGKRPRANLDIENEVDQLSLKDTRKPRTDYDLQPLYCTPCSPERDKVTQYGEDPMCDDDEDDDDDDDDDNNEEYSFDCEEEYDTTENSGEEDWFYFEEMDDEDSSDEEEASLGADDSSRDNLGGELGPLDRGETNNHVNRRSCANCRRQELFPTEEVLHEYKRLGLEMRSSSRVSFRRKYSSIRAAHCGEQVLLCTECTEYLILGPERRRQSSSGINDKKGVWAAYLWSLLDKSGFGSRIWHFFPAVMRGWWSDAVSFNGSVDCTIVKDITVSRLKLLEAVKNGFIGELIKVTDEEELLCPTVLCPWGCTTYPHKVGKVPFDTVLQFCCPYKDIALISPKARFGEVLSARLDYVRPSIADYQCQILQILKPEWTVLPSIWFTNDGPVFATCELHDGGCRDMYFHPPRMPLYAPIPAARSDQLSHVVIKPRIIKGTKRKLRNTTYETVQVRACFSGSDTANVTDTGDFSFASHLTERNESLAIMGRLDIRSHLRHLQRNGQIPLSTVRGMEARAEQYFGHVDLGKWKEGSTFMTLNDAVSLQRQISSEDLMKVQQGAEVVEYTRKWPNEPVWIHRATASGARFNDIPQCRNSSQDSRYAWVLLAMMSTLSHFFVSVDKEIHNPDFEWNGWFLLFTSRSCLQLRYGARKGRRDEHPYKKMPTVTELIGKVSPVTRTLNFSSNHLTWLLSTCSRVSCLSLDHLERDSILTSLKHHAGSVLSTNQDLSEGQAIVCTRSCFGRSFGIANGLPESFVCNHEISGQAVETVFFLRMVILLPEDHTTIGSWNGTVIARHDPREFGHWWYQQRRGKMTAVSSLQELNGLEQWRVAVYLIDAKIQVSELRNQYLEYIGGQSKMFCREHDVPLITSAGQDKSQSHKRCYQTVDGRVCGKKVSLCCLVPGCKSWICSECYNTRIASGSRVDLSPTQTTDSFDENVAGELDSIVEPELDRQDYDGTESVVEGDSDEEYCDVAGDIQDVLVVEPDLPEDDLEVYNENLHDPAIPTTIAGNRPLQVTANIRGESVHEIPGHVILNGCGTLLVRRHHKLNGNLLQQNFLQKLAATTDNVTIPLMYLEGALFPSIFWCSSQDNASVIGAIPSCLLAQPSTVGKYGVASLRDHNRSRITCVDSLAGTDPRYLSFMFDAMANIALNSRHSRVVLNRGFVESEGPSGLAANDPESSTLISDFIDSRRTVRNLSATERDYPFTLFVTITCNQMQQFGVRLYTRQLKNQEQWAKGYYNSDKLSEEELCELDKQLNEAVSSLILRNWLEVRKMIINYLLTSLEGEEGIGYILKLFARDEYQDGEGNLPHVHMLIALQNDIRTEDGLAFVENLVRGASADIVREDEVDRFVDIGLLRDREEWTQVQEDARRYLSHNRCSARCQRRLMDGSLVCRVPDNYISSPDPLRHVHMVYDPGHTVPAVQLLAELGLCEMPSVDNPCSFVARVPVLEASKHFPPTLRGEGKFSAANGTLFLICRGNTNIQVCRTFATSRYLCKYIGKIDENNTVWLAVDGGDERAVTLEKIFLHNTKIEGSARAEAKLQENRRDMRGKPRGRSMSRMEIVQRSLGIPSTITNQDYENVATCPMEERRGIERAAPVHRFINPMLRRSNQPDVEQLADLHPNLIDSIACRKGLPSWRQFGPEQELVIRDHMFSSVSIDKITIFSVRPCELVEGFDSLVPYFKFFTRSRKKLESHCFGMDRQLEESCWIDGLGYQVKIRYRAIDAATQHLQRLLGAGSGRRIVSLLFNKIKLLKDRAQSAGTTAPVDDESDVEFFHRFVDLEIHHRGNPMAPRTLPTVVFSDIKPTNPTKFLVHLLLSMGRFRTEYELLHQPNMLSSFVYAKLLVPRDSPEFESSVNDLIRRYIVEQLAYAPLRTKTLDYYAVEAARIIREVFIDEQLTIPDTPAVLFTSLQEQCTENVEAALKEMKQTVVEAAFCFLSWLDGRSPGFPTKEELLGTVSKTNHHLWSGQLIQNETKGQSDASYAEHQRCAEWIRNIVNNYSNAVTVFVKSLLIVGGPGCGKTFQMMYGVLQCLCKGLLVMTTALLSARARELGGIHFHRLFCIRKGTTPQQIAEAAAIAVMKNPILYAFFLRLDALGIDEFGQLSAELFSAFDIFFRIIRGVNTFFGGVIIFGSIDHVQIRTFTGMPVLLSPHILTSFDICPLDHSVRSARDCYHRLINDHCRMSKKRLLQNRERALDTLISLVSEHCTFVDSWDSPLIPNNAIRIFGKKKPVREAEKTFRQKELKRCKQMNLPFALRPSVDTQMARESHSNWQPATVSTSRQLDTKVKEPRELLFFEFAVYGFTCNKTGFYSQTQLAVMCDVPSTQTVADFGPVELIVAPPGLRFIDFEISSRQQLIGMGWEPVLVAPEQSYSQNLRRGIRGRRHQYPLKLNIAATLHAAMGSEAAAVATQLSCDDKSFELWEKGQFVVLMSRTECAKRVIFVGNKGETLAAIREIVLMTSQYDDYIQHVLDVLCGRNAPGWIPPVINLSNHVLRARDVKLPQGGTGVVYLLVSLKDYTTTYIGQTLQYVGDRLNQHNKGFGALQTSDIQHRPWGLLACVVGFDGSRECLEAFERDWKSRRFQAVQQNHGTVTPIQVANLAPVVMQYSYYRERGLRLIMNSDFQTATEGADRG